MQIMASSNRGKFVSTFQSAEDREREQSSNQVSKENVSNDEIVNGKSVKMYDGDELYNPLDLDNSSDEENDSPTKISSNSSEEGTQKTSNLNTKIDFANPKERENGNVDTKSYDSPTSDVVNEQKDSPFELVKSPEVEKLDDRFLDDDDLLGTALAELEEDEKQAELNKTEENKNDSVQKAKDKKKKKSKDKKVEKSSDKNKKKKKKKKKTKGKDKNTEGLKKKEGGDLKKKDKKKSKGDKDSTSQIQSKEELGNKEVKNIEKDKKQHIELKPKKHKHDKSPSKKKEKKRERNEKRDSSKDRKSKRRNNDDSRERSKRSSKDNSDSESKHKHKHEEHKTRKRTHRDDENNSNNSKRSRKSTADDDKSKKLDSAGKTLTRERKHSYRDISPVEQANKRHRSRSPPSKSSSEHSRKHSNEKTSTKSPVKSSKSKMEKTPDSHRESRKSETRQHHNRSPTHSSDNDNQAKPLHRSSFSQNFEKELKQFKNDHKVEMDKYGDTSSSAKKSTSTKRDRKNSRSPKDHQKEVKPTTPPKDVDSTDNVMVHSPVSEDGLQVVIPIPPNKEEKEEINKELTRKVSSDNSVEFQLSVDEHTEVNDIFDIAVSSQSDDGSVDMTTRKRTLRPGALSINEYKERKKHGHKDEKIIRLSSSSRSDVREPLVEETIENIDMVEPQRKTPSKADDSSHNGDVEPKKSINSDDLYSIPLLDDVIETTQPSKSVEKKIEEPEEEVSSPYNPEASPIDFESPVPSPRGSPSNAAVEDNDVEILAYKDVLAFEDIMKSKVKHEAKKHKRKKLEEMKHEMEGRVDATKKEKRLVDYLIRQAQVEELMKNTLKAYYKSREITKEEYKFILKKAVPQVTMSSSTIIPEKIESLMKKFVRKCKGQRAREEKEKSRRKEQEDLVEQQKELERQLQKNAAIIDSFPYQQMTALNPNLPLPPI